jgi:ATP-binding cassette subfamily B protein
MFSSLTRGIITACIALVIMSVVAVFISGGNAWFGISPGTLVIMFTYTYTITNQFNFINLGLQRFNRAFGDASGMTQVLDEPRLVDDVPGAPELKVTEGRIDFEHLNFWYSDGGTKTQVFDDFNLHIPAGQRVGLVGRSGAGKTTITKLLLRLSDIQEGKILVDGQNVAETTQQSLRRSIAYVPQEPLLFHRTIAENIAYGRPDATPWSRSARRRARRTRSNSSSSCRRASRRSPASAASSSPAGSASASPLPARFWPTAPSSCSTRPRARSTPKARSSCRMRSQS